MGKSDQKGMVMSLEQLLTENTQAMRDLTAALNAMRHLPPIAAAPEIQCQAPTTPEASAPTAVITETPVATITVTPEAPAKPVATITVTPEAPAKPVTLADVKPLFIKVAAANRPAAVALLGEFGCSKLTEMKPDQFADFLARLEAF